MSPTKLNILTLLLAVCGLIASTTFIWHYRRLSNRDKTVWFEAYGHIVEKAGQSVVAVEVELDGSTPERIIQNSGSGFILDTNGHLVTNEHVIHDARRIRIILADRRQYIARVIGADPLSDIAVLKIEADHITPLPFGPTTTLLPGEVVISLGNPLGTGADGRAVATFGHINRLNQSLKTDIDKQGERYYQNMIQTTAVTLPGHSGGPLINVAGQIVGIITAVAGMEKQFGFAIALDPEIRERIEQLKEGQKIVYPCLGVTLAFQIDQITQQRLGLKEISGALVAEVVPGLPAEQAGIRRGDLIRAVNRQRIYNPAELVKCIRRYRPRDTVDIELLRPRGDSARNLTIPVTLEARNNKYPIDNAP